MSPDVRRKVDAARAQRLAAEQAVAQQEKQASAYAQQVRVLHYIIATFVPPFATGLLEFFRVKRLRHPLLCFPVASQLPTNGTNERRLLYSFAVPVSPATVARHAYVLDGNPYSHRHVSNR